MFGSARATFWLVAGLAAVVAPIIHFAEQDIVTGLLVSLSIVAMLVLGMWVQDVHITTWSIVAVALALELATQGRFWILEMIILMLGGLLMTVVGKQIRKGFYNASEISGP